MIILIDSREKNPLTFKNKFISECKTVKLNIGDYHAEFKDGFRPQIIFERKSIPDLFGTLGKGYSRFKKEIMRAKQHDITIILIVEGSLTKVLCGYNHSQISGLSIVSKMFTLWIKYGVIPVFCKNRDEMSEYIIQFYIACGKQYIKNKPI